MSHPPVSVQSKADVLLTFTDGLGGDALKVPTLFELADVRALLEGGSRCAGWPRTTPRSA